MTIQASGLEVFPEEYRADIERAVQLLKTGGCREVYVFGSVVEGRTREGSDLDLAVRGCPPGSFFPLLGELLTELEHSVDLVDLDREPRLVGFLQKHELLVHVG
jgi:predicted nucleotidyltransferase